MSPPKTPQQPEPKIFGKVEENRFTTPRVLSMRSYAQTYGKHNKSEEMGLVLHMY